MQREFLVQNMKQEHILQVILEWKSLPKYSMLEPRMTYVTDECS